MFEVANFWEFEVANFWEFEVANFLGVCFAHSLEKA